MIPTFKLFKNNTLGICKGKTYLTQTVICMMKLRKETGMDSESQTKGNSENAGCLRLTCYMIVVFDPGQ